MRTEQQSRLFLQPWRPWMQLYGVRLKRGRVEAEEDERPRSVIEQMLPDELVLAVFARLPIAALGAVQCVCRQWRGLGRAPSLWRPACAEAFGQSDPALNERLLRQAYRGCWRTMFLERCHLRFDGVYVSRNTYVRQGVAEFRKSRSVYLVCYYRYFRFLSDGTFAYRTSPETIAKVARSLQAPPPPRRQLPAAPRRQQQGVPPAVQHGRYRLDHDRLHTAMLYENSTSTEVRCRMRLRSTVPGANNRLDVESIISYDRDDGTAVPLASAAAGEDELGNNELEGAERRQYTRGLNAFVFVPWEHSASSVLNLPVSQMDVYIPG